MKVTPHIYPSSERLRFVHHANEYRCESIKIVNGGGNVTNSKNHVTELYVKIHTIPLFLRR